MGVEGRGRIGQGSQRADGHKVWLLGQLETILFFSSSCCHPGGGEGRSLACRVGSDPSGSPRREARSTGQGLPGPASHPIAILGC